MTKFIFYPFIAMTITGKSYGHKLRQAVLYGSEINGLIRCRTILDDGWLKKTRRKAGYEKK